MVRFIKVCIMVCACSVAVLGQLSETEQSWNKPVEPFRIIGNVYYVGASDLTSYLIATPKGHILIDSGMAETVPQVRVNIEKLGFKLSDIKYLLNSHAHYDHAGGLAELRRVTGAKLLVSRGDAGLMSRGGRKDPNFGDSFPFEATQPDETFDDGKQVKVGGSELTANVTPGHTAGCTTWTTTAVDRGRKYKVMFVCSTSAPGYKLVGNEAYPKITADYFVTFSRLKRLRPDVFLGSHGQQFDLLGKIEVLKTRPSVNPFIDPKGFLDYVTESESSFKKALASQQSTR
ncbi:MAG: subclass B3 metallo-beta-lactamase [Acidobacteriota bacterium]